MATVDAGMVPGSSLAPIDRRGLGEVVTWACILVCLTVIVCVLMVLQAAHNQAIEVPNTILGIIGGVVTAFVARGTQGAVERSGASDAFNTAASALRNTLDEHHAMMAPFRAHLASLTTATPTPVPSQVVISPPPTPKP